VQSVCLLFVFSMALVATLPPAEWGRAIATQASEGHPTPKTRRADPRIAPAQILRKIHRYAPSQIL
jgi:hypothetical protein